MRKIIIILSILLLGGTRQVFAAPIKTFLPTILPISDNLFDLGTTTGSLSWRNIFYKGNLTNSNMSNGCASWASGVLTSLGVACGSGGGSGTFPFSADTNYGQVVYSTSTPTLWLKSGIFASSTSQILYASTTALSSTGNAYFATDGGFVGIGTTTAQNSRLTLYGAAGTDTSALRIYNTADYFDYKPALQVYKSRAGAILQKGDHLLQILALGNSGSAYIDSAQIRFTIDGTPTAAGAMPSRITFETRNASVGGGTFERMRIDRDGNVGIGTSTPAGKLDLYGDTDARFASFNASAPSFLTLYNNDTISSSVLNLTNTNNGAADYGTNILFRGGYGGTSDAKGTEIQTGKVAVNSEQNFTSTASTQDSYMALSTTLDGNLGEKVRITSGGKVGIGTTSPQGKLSLQGTAASTNRNLEVSDSTGRPTLIVQDNGAIAIGTSSPFAADALTIYGTTFNAGRYSRFSSGGGLPTFDFNDNSIGVGGIIIQNTQAGSPNYGTGVLFKLGYNGSQVIDGTPVLSGSIDIGAEVGMTSNPVTQDAYMRFTTALDGTVAERMRITSGGNVGIGTTTPWANSVLTLATSTGKFLTFFDATTTPSWTFSVTGGNLGIATSSNSTGATTTPPAFQLNNTGSAGISVATTSSGTNILNLGNNPSTTNGSSTIIMGKLQWDGYDSGGARRCTFVNSSGVLTTISGACNP